MGRSPLKEKWCPGCQRTLPRANFKEFTNNRGVVQIHLRCSNCEGPDNGSGRTPIALQTAETVVARGRPKLTEKTCPGCGRLLRRRDFYEYQRKSDGVKQISHYCKTCSSARMLTKPVRGLLEAAQTAIDAWESWTPSDKYRSEDIIEAMAALHSAIKGLDSE